MKKNILNMLAFIAISILLVSCGGRSQNRKLVEAQEIHTAMMMKHDSIFESLQVQEKRVAKKLETISPNNPDRAAYASMERSIKRSYDLLEKWKSGITEVPGFEQKNTAAANKYSGTVDPSDMSDQEILDLQKAYSDKLNQIGQKIGELVTTMDIYTKQ